MQKKRDINWFEINYHLFDLVSICTSSINTIIIFFWVNYKLSNADQKSHSKLFTTSSIFLVVYYFLFIIFAFIETLYFEEKKKFYLVNNLNYNDGVHSLP
jgi:hypothetical protein